MQYWHAEKFLVVPADTAMAEVGMLCFCQIEIH